MARAVVGLFKSEAQATSAVRALVEAGFTKEAIGILIADTAPSVAQHALEEPLESDTPVDAMLGREGAAGGGILGLSVGALLATTGVLVIPGIGPLIAGGILVTALAGSAMGALAGGLVGMGVPRHDAEYYEAQVQAGYSLVSVVTDGRDAEAGAVLTEIGAETVRNGDDTVIASTEV